MPVRHVIHIMFTLIAISVLLGACGHHNTEPSEPDCEVTIRISMVQNINSMIQNIPDPGSDHGEWNADGWDALTVFFVYSNGNVDYRTISRTEFMKLEEYGDGCRLVPFTLLSGHVSHIYAFASANPQPEITSPTADIIRNLKTRMLTDTEVENPKDYLLGLYSGIDSTGYDIAVSETPAEAQHIHLTLNRLAAKIDIQYDLEPAYESGKFISPAMSAITFSGMQQGWFFPSVATDIPVSPALGYEQSVSSNISEHNGRVVFYTFPGACNSFTFNVDFAPVGNTAYKAAFASPLRSASWHKVNFSVTGSTATADADGVKLDLTLKSSN